MTQLSLFDMYTHVEKGSELQFENLRIISEVQKVVLILPVIFQPS